MAAESRNDLSSENPLSTRFSSTTTTVGRIGGHDRPGSRVPTQLRSVSLGKKLSLGKWGGRAERSSIFSGTRGTSAAWSHRGRASISWKRWNGTGQDSSTNGRYSPVTKGNHHRSGGTGSSSRHKLSESRRYFAGEFRRERVAAGWPTFFLLFSLSLSLFFSL